ncbi:hypothetical protein [Orlajensenia leifsoniae]|uniref:Uncharacterized protein n=1 Tax=Orlajensenia leifsoniae TaxID=2561933 RepID=A0A4Y9R6X9_9MICO|nr:hypothetical protein [Leifsonia flava]TFV99888.1 hypothetical protein E4M00_01400 [Leifsonia flava]
MSDNGALAESDPSPSGLMTRRMAAERGRTAGFMQILVGLAWLTVGVWIFSSGDQGEWYWVKLVGFAALGVWFVVMGIAQLRARAKRIAAFDAQHGVNAGRQ